MFKRKIVIGRVVRVLRVARVGFFYAPLRWRWKKVFFRGFRLDPENEMNRHVLVVGESGGGKSNACKLILRQLSMEGANFIVFDPHNEYIGSAAELGAKVYDALYNKINIFELDNATVREKVGELAALFKRIFRLGEVQYTVLYNCIDYTYSIAMRKGKSASVSELLYTINVFMKNPKSSSELNTLLSLRNRFSVLSNQNAREMSIGELLWKRSIIAMSSIHTNEAQAIYIEGILRKIYANMTARRGERPFYIIVDEAEKLEASNIIARLAAEGRKYGIGIIAIAQRAKSVTSSIRSNSSVMIAFCQREPEELNYLANAIAAGNELNRFVEVKKALRNLRRGTAIVARSGAEPVIVRFARFNDATNMEELVLECARGVAKREEIVKVASERGVAGDAIGREIDEMVRDGKLVSYEVAEGAYKGTWYAQRARNSTEHDIMVALIGKALAAAGIPNRIYNSSNGPDIVAYSKGEEVAVEYETGKKSVEDTLQMLKRRLEKFRKVVVVVNKGSIEAYKMGLEGINVKLLDSGELESIKDCVEG